jgi:hypothetical protein
MQIINGRVTDEVEHYRQLGEYRGVVRVIRKRPPERLRWRTALSTATEIAGGLQGRERMRIEEPIREMLLDLEDKILRRESALDARRFGVDLDRGEILPKHNLWELKRVAYITRVELDHLARYLKFPADSSKPIDTAAVVLVGRALAEVHRKRAQKLYLRVQEANGSSLMLHEKLMLERADYDTEVARRWSAFSKTMVQGSH